MEEQTSVDESAAPTKLRPWFFLIFGLPALLRAWVLWDKEPRTGWAYVSLGSGVVMCMFFALTLWVNRKPER
jgi:hypothetical protein